MKDPFNTPVKTKRKYVKRKKGNQENIQELPKTKRPRKNAKRFL